MGIFEELKARGLLAQLTDEEGIRELINNGKATFYIGFDPTADSLHVGHFMALCLMKRLQMAGNKPIALLGGGTGMIGDPSGKTDMRKMLTKEDINHNIECFKKQMSRFIDFSERTLLLCNQYVTCRVFQATYGQRWRINVPRVQLHDHAELRFLRALQEIWLQPSVWRR